jgi:glutamyl/glutaminyl-tRNA synthetase
VLGNDGKKLSKRTGDVSVESYLERGYLPEALLNFVALLGWNPKTEQEIMSLDEMTTLFDITTIHRAGAVLDPVKLDWMNGEYIRSFDTEALHIRLSEYLKQYRPEFYTLYGEKDFSYNAKVMTEVQPRMKRFEQFEELTECFYRTRDWDTSIILNPKMKVESFTEARYALDFARTLFEEKVDFSSLESIKELLLSEIAHAGHANGIILWPLRVALSGMERSP